MGRLTGILFSFAVVSPPPRWGGGGGLQNPCRVKKHRRATRAIMPEPDDATCPTRRASILPAAREDCRGSAAPPPPNPPPSEGDGLVAPRDRDIKSRALGW